ncbi:hypothetical protein LTR66_003456 [Elasticomyces elasticus]|nr:hypothetical protein LTR50_005612 [Elasticomyces elasticus]KAK4997065.1 hypothetical protein LTR66_003456 [Elasticomyces elasticus]
MHLSSKILAILGFAGLYQLASATPVFTGRVNSTAVVDTYTSLAVPTASLAAASLEEAKAFSLKGNSVPFAPLEDLPYGMSLIILRAGANTPQVPREASETHSWPTAVIPGGPSKFTTLASPSPDSVVSTTTPIVYVRETPTPHPTHRRTVHQGKRLCNTHYRWFFDSFEIYGKYWDHSKLDSLGVAGEGLHKQLKGCSVISKWKFEVYEDQTEWDFKAQGRTTILQKRCIENAIMSSGAPKGHCYGSG